MSDEKQEEIGKQRRYM